MLNLETQLGAWREILLLMAKEIILKPIEMKFSSLIPEKFGLWPYEGYQSENKLKYEDIVSLARTGLVTLKDGHIEFIHRSFADYFMSEYLICNIQNEQQLLFGEILLNDSYWSIRKYFDNQIRHYIFRIIISLFDVIYTISFKCVHTV